MYRFILLSVFLTTMSCQKKMTIISSNYPPLVSHYGAIPDDNKDDTEAFQRALDDGQLILEEGKYLISKTVFINRYGTKIKSDFYSIIEYSGKGAFLSAKRKNGNYPVNCGIENLNINLINKNSIGISVKISHSMLRGIRVTLYNSDSTGMVLEGDEKGTGPYYNSFYNCNVQGRCQLGKDNQIGIEFKSAENNRAPNANTFYNGRFGQVNKGFVICGGGNTFYSPTLEGIQQNCFYFDHPKSPVGCVSNIVYSPYIEGAKGVTMAFFGKNAISCGVINPFVTSIGAEGNISLDKSTRQNNGVILSGEQFKKDATKKKY